MKYSKAADVVRLVLIQLYLFFTLCVYTLAIWYVVKQYFRYPYLLHIDNVFLVPMLYVLWWTTEAKVKCCSYIPSVGILYPTLSCDLSLCKLPNICATSAAAYRILACPPQFWTEFQIAFKTIYCIVGKMEQLIFTHYLKAYILF